MILYFVASILIVLLDQLCKIIIEKSFFLGQSKPIINKVLNFTYVQNHGAAFGILQGRRWFFIVLTAVFFAAVAVYLVKKAHVSCIEKLAASFILGGAAGNLIDRAYFGYVRDFIEVDFFNFPVFNIADCFVCVGAIIYVIFILFEGKNNGKNNTDSVQ